MTTLPRPTAARAGRRSIRRALVSPPARAPGSLQPLSGNGIPVRTGNGIPVRTVPTRLPSRPVGALRVAGLLSIGTAVIAADVLIPFENLGSPGALTIPALVLIAGILGAAVAEMFALGARRLLNAYFPLVGAVIFFLLLDPMQGLYAVPVGRESIVATFTLIGAFVMAATVGTLLPPLPLPSVLREVAEHRYSPRALAWFLCILFGLGMFNFAFTSGFSLQTMLLGLSQDRFSAPWSRGDQGGWSAFTDFLQYFGYLLPPMTVAAAVQGKHILRPTVLLGIVFSIAFIPFVVQGGGRRSIGAILLATVLCWLAANRERLRPTHVLGTVAALGFVLILFDAMLATRNIGFQGFQWSIDDFSSVRVDDNFRRMAQSIELVPARYPHAGWQYVLWVVVRPVPRILWPDKPLGAGFDLPSALGLTGVSLSSGAPSEWYVAFGAIGVLVAGLLYGALARWWSQLLDRQYPPTGMALYAVGCMALVVGIRSSIELVLGAYPVICWLVLHHVFVRSSRKDPSSPARGAVAITGGAQAGP